MMLCRKIFLDDLTDDPSPGRSTLPWRVLGANRRDRVDCAHLYHHWVLRYGCGFGAEVYPVSP